MVVSPATSFTPVTDARTPVAPSHHPVPAATLAEARQDSTIVESLAPDLAAALRARLAALDDWIAQCDPDQAVHPDSLIEAAARYSLIIGPNGPRFEPAGFAEFILFIEDMPF